MKYGAIIIGAGPAGLFAANELADSLKVLVIDKKSIVGGAGAVTDGKLNLSTKIGMDLDELKLSEEEAKKLIRVIDKIFLENGADPTLSGTNLEEVNKLVKKAAKHDVELISAEQRHMGSDSTHKIMKSFKNKLESKGIEFMLNTEVVKIKKNEDAFFVSNGKEVFKSKYLLVCPGRSGAYWFRAQAKELGIATLYGPIDVGVRVEIPAEVYDPITNILYDPKFKLETRCHRDKVRTFCTNPRGRVRIERDQEYKLINGDALKKMKTDNTNFALLYTISLTEPMGDTTEFARAIITYMSQMGKGKPLVQRWGDLERGRRSKIETFFDKNCGYNKLKPTLEVGSQVCPADLSLGYAGRIIDNIKETITVLDRIVEGIAHPSTLLYAPEIKFYDTKYPTSKDLETSVKNLFVAGDGAGKSRGIVGAALTGILAAHGIKKK
ncbi:FAD-dependent oxidoreductase [Candidatus Woesearchaeota archaeon]|nr:FAD-dependent oxidoreductase [Candidatus Woesearchaeota archaeon]